MADSSIHSLFGEPVHAVNVGLNGFAESLRSQDTSVVHLDWSPPLVPKLHHTRAGTDIDDANAEAAKRVMQGRPALVGMGIASEVIPGYHKRLILHAGPPSPGSACAGRSLARSWALWSTKG